MPVAIQVPRADYSTTSALAHKLAIHHLLQFISSLPQSLSLAFRLPPSQLLGWPCQVVRARDLPRPKGDDPSCPVG